MPQNETCNRRTVRVPTKQCVAPGSAERDPDDGFVERPRGALFPLCGTSAPSGDGVKCATCGWCASLPEGSCTATSGTLTFARATLIGNDPFVPE
jgi:hypothetical protein